MSDSRLQAEVRYPSLYRLVNGLGILVLLFMAFTGWMAYSQEEVTWGLPVSVIMVGLSIFWLLALAASPQVVQFSQDQLIIRRWLGTTRLGYQEITAVRQSRTFITIIVPTQTVRLYKLYANSDAKLMTALEKYVPVANAVQGNTSLAVSSDYTATRLIATPSLKWSQCKALFKKSSSKKTAAGSTSPPTSSAWPPTSDFNPLRCIALPDR